MTAQRCPHEPVCPQWHAGDAVAARVVADCQEQGWSLLCNGLVSFDDLVALRPDGVVIGVTARGQVDV